MADGDSAWPDRASGMDPGHGAAARSCRTLRRNRGKRQCECSAELIVNLCSGRQPLVLEKRTHARIENRFGLLHIAIRAKPAFAGQGFVRDDNTTSEGSRVGEGGYITGR